MDINKNKIMVSDIQVSILDSMIDCVRLIDRDNNIIHVNESMKNNIGKDTLGMKCYEGIGQNKKCELCISEKTIATGKTYRKEEIVNNKIYDVVSSPVYDKDGNIVAVVEVFRDTTKEKELERSIIEKNKRMTSDIEFATQMQENILPSKGIYGNLKIDYEYKPSEMLSGDIFDVYTIDKDNIGIYMCDVVGHGVAASMISMYVKQTMRALSKRVLDINKTLQELHRTFLALNFDDDKYFSIFSCIFNKDTRNLKYLNAGHNCLPFFIRNDKIEILEAKGYPICNIFDTVDYEVFELSLKEKDKLVFYTDGIVETKNYLGEEFGIERLKNIIEEAENLPERVLEEMKKFKGKQKDDVAILEIEIL
ncbi:MAG: SpoIIE family protein phosphatase [Eubacteriales bacterium]